MKSNGYFYSALIILAVLMISAAIIVPHVTSGIYGAKTPSRMEFVVRYSAEADNGGILHILRLQR